MILLNRMTAYAQDSSKPWVVRLVCGLGILYVLSPLDFLPDLMANKRQRFAIWVTNHSALENPESDIVEIKTQISRF